MRSVAANLAGGLSDGLRKEVRAEFSPVLPRPLEYTERGGGRSVQELQSLIEEALVLLANEEEAVEAPPVRELLNSHERPAALGAAPGSEVRHRSSLFGRAAKTVLGLSAALFIALVPLKNVLVATSTEAYVNAPLVSVLAPVAGTFVLDDEIGAKVGRRGVLGFVEPAQGGTRVPLVAPSAGKIWAVAVPPGTDVSAGEEVATIAACASTSVMAAVSESVYDRLVPGMAARFNFLGSDRFYTGTVANLLGRSAGTANLAIPLASLPASAYRVLVSLPGLSALPDCAIGKRGEIVFQTGHG